MRSGHEQGRGNGVRDTALGQGSRERQAQVSLPNHIRQTKKSGSHPPRSISSTRIACALNVVNRLSKNADVTRQAAIFSTDPKLYMSIFCTFVNMQARSLLPAKTTYCTTVEIC